jgi:hypothetical protein
LSYCPRSSLPAAVLAWLAGRLADLAPPRPPGRGSNRPLALEVRPDAVAAVVLDGLSYRRAARMVGISKTEVGDSLDLLPGPLGDLGLCQPDGTFITSLDELLTRSPSLAPAILGRGSPEDGPASLMCRAGAPAQQLFCDTGPAWKALEGMTVGAGQGRRARGRL